MEERKCGKGINGKKGLRFSKNRRTGKYARQKTRTNMNKIRKAQRRIKKLARLKAKREK